MRKAVPTAEARDFRKITRLHSLTFQSPLAFYDDITVKGAVREVVQLRDAQRVRVITGDGAVISGSPDEVLPILNALLTHADETDHAEEQQ